MTNNPMHLKTSARCTACGFTTYDLHLIASHSCDVQRNEGRCEDYPCCGHEMGDCNGLKYGSDEAIKSDPHVLCDHENGTCEVEDSMTEEDWEEYGSAQTDAAIEAYRDLYEKF